MIINKIEDVRVGDVVTYHIGNYDRDGYFVKDQRGTVYANPDGDLLVAGNVIIWREAGVGSTVSSNWKPETRGGFEFVCAEREVKLPTKVGAVILVDNFVVTRFWFGQIQNWIDSAGDVYSDEELIERGFKVLSEGVDVE